MIVFALVDKSGTQMQSVAQSDSTVSRANVDLAYGLYGFDLQNPIWSTEPARSDPQGQCQV